MADDKDDIDPGADDNFDHDDDTDDDNDADFDDAGENETREFDPVRALHEHLQATEELPVEREAGWRIGEAQALAADMATGDLDSKTVRERAAEIRELLAEVDRTGDHEADDRVAAARELADRLAEQ